MNVSRLIVMTASLLVSWFTGNASDSADANPFPKTERLTQRSLERLIPTDTFETICEKFGWAPVAEIVPIAVYEDAEVESGVYLFFFGPGESRHVWFVLRAPSFEAMDKGRVAWPAEWKGMTMQEAIEEEGKRRANKPVQTNSVDALRKLGAVTAISRSPRSG